MTLSDLDRVIATVQAIAEHEAFSDSALVAPGEWEPYCVFCGHDGHYDNCPETMATKALTLLRQMREGAVEGYAAKDASGWLRLTDQDAAFNPVLVPALLIPTPED